MQKVRVKFTKGPEVKFISHLDTIRTFERAIRRSGIPIAYSSGYNPRMRLAWGPPLSVGIESSCELVDLFMETWVNPGRLKETLAPSFPKGFDIIEAEIADAKGPSLDTYLNRAEYSVLIQSGQAEQLRHKAEEILKRENIDVEKKGKIVNKRPMLHGIKVMEDPLRIEMTLQVGASGTLKPKEVTQLLDGITAKGIKRTRLFAA